MIPGSSEDLSVLVLIYKVMSLYNLVNGVNPATFFILPMLGKHPDEYPRFRDCFIGKATNDDVEVDAFGIPVKKQELSKKLISIYTRVGGGNREDYENEISELRAMKSYIEDYDDDFDSTFATFVFEVPEEVAGDYSKVINGEIMETSQQYKDQVDKVFPKLKGKLPWHKKEKS